MSLKYDIVFDDKLVEIVNRNPASNLLSIPGVYELVAEEFNNLVLQELSYEDKTERM